MSFRCLQFTHKGATLLAKYENQGIDFENNLGIMGKGIEQCSTV